MRRSLGLAGLACALLLTPAATAAQTDDLKLVPNWPASMDEARREPILLTSGPPLADEASHGAVEPGSSTAGSSYSFDWTLQNADGSPGPAGDIPLAAGQPVLVDVYLSAEPPPSPADAEAPLQAPGAAPLLTVETTLAIGEEHLGPQRATHTLVSTPDDAGVQRYRASFQTDQLRLEAGEGLDVEVTVHQANSSGERATQPGWRIHTGSQHPSGLTLPTVAEDDDEGGVLSLQETSQVPREQVRTGAYAALAASLLAAGWAARRGYREFREGYGAGRD